MAGPVFGCGSEGSLGETGGPCDVGADMGGSWGVAAGPPAGSELFDAGAAVVDPEVDVEAVGVGSEDGGGPVHADAEGIGDGAADVRSGVAGVEDHGRPQVAVCGSVVTRSTLSGCLVQH